MPEPEKRVAGNPFQSLGDNVLFSPLWSVERTQAMVSWNA